MIMSWLAIQFKDFHAMDAPLIYTETQGSTHQMKTLDSCSSGIDHQHIPLRITHDFQDMRMAADKQIRLISVNKFTCTGVVSSRIATDMSHENLYTLTFKKTVQGMIIAETMVVTVTCDSDKRLVCSYLFGKIHSSSEIACMPYLVHLRKEVLEFPGEHSVCV